MVQSGADGTHMQHSRTAAYYTIFPVLVTRGRPLIKYTPC
jgi:hypothetical protein